MAKKMHTKPYLLVDKIIYNCCPHNTIHIYDLYKTSHNSNLDNTIHSGCLNNTCHSCVLDNTSHSYVLDNISATSWCNHHLCGGLGPSHPGLLHAWTKTTVMMKIRPLGGQSLLGHFVCKFNCVWPSMDSTRLLIWVAWCGWFMI